MRFSFLTMLFWAGSLWAAPALNLVPANFQPLTDSQGFIWDIDSSSGYVGNGSNCFSSSFYLEFNGNGFSASSPAMMSADGSEYFFTGRMHPLEVTRRVRVEAKGAFIRYVDTIRNSSPSPVNGRLSIRIQFSNQMQAAVTDTGGTNLAALSPKDSGIAVLSMPGQSIPSALFLFAGRGAKLRPTVQNQGNSRFTVTYPLALAPGESVSLVHAAAQRHLNGLPAGKELTRLFAPLNSPRLLSDLPPGDRKLIGNFTAGSFSTSGAPTLSSALFDAINLERAATDVLAIGTSTRLRGTASCAALEIESRWGKTTVPFEKVSAILGGRREARLLLRDGQILSGALKAQGLKFVLSTGTTIELETKSLDRLILRTPPKEAPLAPAAWGFVETHDGDRLALQLDPALRLPLTTAWGVREILAEDLLGCGPVEENPLSFRVVLRDGSNFISFLDGEEIGFDTLLFGKKTFRTADVRQIAVNQPKVAPETADLPPEQARVEITGGQVLSGHIDLAELHFLSPAGVIPVAANLIRTLHSSNEDGTESVPVFTAVVWGGSTVAGPLRETTLPVRTGGSVIHVPVSDLRDAFVPSPAMPEKLREKVAGLIRDLGHPDWEKREGASRELGELGAVTSAQLQETLKLTSDAEVRRRAQGLLDALSSL